MKNLPQPSKHGLSLSLSLYLSISLFGHTARLDENLADAKKILTTFPAEDWKRPPGRPRITWSQS